MPRAEIVPSNGHEDVSEADPITRGKPAPPLDRGMPRGDARGAAGDLHVRRRRQHRRCLGSTRLDPGTGKLCRRKHLPAEQPGSGDLRRLDVWNCRLSSRVVILSARSRLMTRAPCSGDERWPPASHQLQHGDGKLVGVDGGGGVPKGRRRRSFAEALACPRLVPHHLVVGEHLLDRRACRQRGEFVGCAREELPTVGDNRRTGCAIRTCRRASGE